MPLFPIRIAPGLYLNKTPYASKTRWVDGNLVRFKDGQPQQMGGWLASDAIGAIDGVPRCAISYRPNSQHGRYMMIGTHKGVFIYDGGTLQNVSPAGFSEGRVDTILGSGYGGGLYSVTPYGRSTYGSTALLSAATWSMDLWGEDVVAVGHTAQICAYSPGSAAFVAIPNAPSAQAVVVDDNRRLFALGAAGIPNRVAWSSQENRELWTAAADNTAGGFILNTQSRLICGARGRGMLFIWSETDLFGLFPTYNTLVYGHERLGANCGAVGPNAAVVVGETAYWMGQDGFYRFAGQVERMECDIHDYVFGNAETADGADFNLTQRVKVHVRHNSLHDEIWFMYPSGQSNENDRVAILNTKTGAWSKANISRTAWCDRGAFPNPMAFDAAGTLFVHETGHSANGEVMPAFVESAPFELGNGDRTQQIRSFWPDARMFDGSATLLLRLRNTPAGPEFFKGPYTFTGGTERVMLATTGRQLAIRIASAAPGDHWEIGEPRIELTAGGGR